MPEDTRPFPVASQASRRRRDREPSPSKGEVMNSMAAALCLALGVGLVGAQRPGIPTTPRAETPEALQSEIGALKAAGVAWREIPWKTCLLAGLEESRASGKPVLLWVFIDRPTDDARC